MIGHWRHMLQERLDAALLTAVCDERVWHARALLVLGADPDAAGWCICGLASALSAACLRENPGLVRLLLSSGADPDGSPLEHCAPYERIAGMLSEQGDGGGIAQG